jgi:hypothetical protein
VAQGYRVTVFDRKTATDLQAAGAVPRVGLRLRGAAASFTAENGSSSAANE